jgi:hypothetical protein
MQSYVRERPHVLLSECTMLAPAQLMRNWSEPRPSNPGDLGSSVTGEAGRVYYTGVDLLLISYLRRRTCCCWIAF